MSPLIRLFEDRTSELTEIRATAITPKAEIIGEEWEKTVSRIAETVPANDTRMNVLSPAEWRFEERSHPMANERTRDTINLRKIE